MKKIKTLSLFSGAGGLDIGFHKAGFDIVACVEINPAYTKSLEKNKLLGKYFSKETSIHCQDIRTFDPTPYQGIGIECIIGGPPCQTFSAAGRRAGGVLGTDDARGQLFLTYCTILDAIQPKTFVFENVYGLPGANEGGPWREIVSAFTARGFTLSFDVLDAADYGTPQHRERLFIVGTHKDFPAFQFPRPTHGPDAVTGTPLVSVFDAISDLQRDDEVSQPLGGLYGHLLEDVPEGLNYAFFTREMGHPEPQFAWRSKFHDFLAKVKKNEPCRTIKAQPGKFTGPFHWKNRHFTLPELKRLQSFPDDYEIVGTFGKAVEQIGNSVPPKLAHAIAGSLREQVFERRESGLTYPIRPFGFKSTFRQRQRERSAAFKEIAKHEIKVRYANIVLIDSGKTSTQEQRTYSITERFNTSEVLASEVLALGEQRFTTDYSQNGHNATLSISEAQATSRAVHIQIEIQGLAKYLSHLDFLVVDAKVRSLDSLFGVWSIIQQVLVTKSRFFSLIDIYGHYANRGDTVKVQTKVKGLRRTSLVKAIEFFGSSKNCGVLLDWSVAAELVDVETLILKNTVEELRGLRFDVRSSESHVTIREDGVLCTYPFPMLSQKAHFDSSISAWVA